MDISQIISALDNALLLRYGCNTKTASPQQTYRALCLVINDILHSRNASFDRDTASREHKQIYYMSMEFLVGTSLRNNLYNLGLEPLFTKALASCGIDIHEMYEMEPDAGLGNGGLGRLASCYMDSATTMGLPLTGFSIRYEFGIFKQKIIDGWQMEFPDDWLTMGDVWLNPRNEDAVEVRFGGEVHPWDDDGKFRVSHVNYQPVMAIPNDLFISGYATDAVNRLILWSASSPKSFDMSAFSRGDYAKALEGDTMAEVISKVLYPSDYHEAGKSLRLRQQYLLVSASVQTILNKHLRKYRTLSNLPEKVSIHINDTHPALCVPELMRLLIDEYDYDWEPAWDLTCRTLSYTNHTVMNEALECWQEDLFSRELPRIHQIIREINHRLMEHLRRKYGDHWEKLRRMAVLCDGRISMANLCLSACHSVNGVSELHTDILRDSIFRDYCELTPKRLINVTNGIAHRRWLCQSNPLLDELLRDLIGNEYMTDSMQLEQLLRYQNDSNVLNHLQCIKLANKNRLSNLILKRNGIMVDPDSMFDIQIKRLHEYKRQLLNVLQIIHMYLQIKASPHAPFQPRTFVFAAKASVGYIMAKHVIRLITAVSSLINFDPEVRDKLKVIFVEDYSVSLAEIIIPAAEISEQISVAGKEASGTGNMKLMINGAVTLGTLDGANVEIHRRVGDENMFLFGLKADQVVQLLSRRYRPRDYYENIPEVRAVIDFLSAGFNGMRFDEIVNSLLIHDPYLCLADFSDYVRAQKCVSDTYSNKECFARMSLINIAHAGYFSSDRAVGEYAQHIWHCR